jgi:hypothetical protein
MTRRTLCKNYVARFDGGVGRRETTSEVGLRSEFFFIGDEGPWTAGKEIKRMSTK